jgi:HAD superfamily hydrolase (TIGR01509 family)
MTTFVGQNFRGMMMGLQEKYDFKMDKVELEAMVTKEEDAVIAMLLKKAEPCVGVNEQLEILKKDGKYGLAVVSSSALRRVKASIEKVNQTQYFPPDDIFSAATSLPVPTSKPDPAIYLHALKTLGKTADECVAVEDSKSGTLSAVRAGIHVIAYVGSYESEEEMEKMAGVLTDLGAEVVMREWKDFQECMRAIEEGKGAKAKI